jgi:hypothetical protein
MGWQMGLKKANHSLEIVLGESVVSFELPLGIVAAGINPWPQDSWLAVTVRILAPIQSLLVKQKDVFHLLGINFLK